MRLSADEIARATGANTTNAAVYADPLNKAMDQFEINTPQRVAAFLATVSVESDELTKVREDLYYKDPVRLAQIFPRAFKDAAAAAPYARNPKALDDLLYKGYSGRGLIQLTWRENYQRAGTDLGYDYVSNPDLVCDPKHAALTAAWFWATAGCNAAADRGDMDDVTRRVNGPKKLKLAERTALFNSIKGWLA